LRKVNIFFPETIKMFLSKPANNPRNSPMNTGRVMKISKDTVCPDAFTYVWVDNLYAYEQTPLTAGNIQGLLERTPDTAGNIQGLLERMPRTAFRNQKSRRPEGMTCR
jgi:hypothetical protein